MTEPRPLGSRRHRAKAARQKGMLNLMVTSRTHVQLLKLSCANCSAPLEIGGDLERFACRQLLRNRADRGTLWRHRLAEESGNGHPGCATKLGPHRRRTCAGAPGPRTGRDPGYQSRIDPHGEAASDRSAHSPRPVYFDGHGRCRDAGSDSARHILRQPLSCLACGLLGDCDHWCFDRCLLIAS